MIAWNDSIPKMRREQRKRPSDVMDFLSAASAWDGECRVWCRAVGSNGYGQLMTAGVKKGAHRFSYEFFVGPIPDGLVIDHLCRNRACINPAHLEPVTTRENIVRGLVPETIGRLNRSKTHCLRGHEFAGENLEERPSGSRGCKACRKIQTRESERRRRARVRAARIAQTSTPFTSARSAETI